jgi:hypothetical protein
LPAFQRFTHAMVCSREISMMGNVSQVIASEIGPCNAHIGQIFCAKLPNLIVHGESYED